MSWRPARVARKVRTNKVASGVRPDRRRDSEEVPVQSVMSRQRMPPQAAPAGVAARSIRTVAKNAALMAMAPIPWAEERVATG